MYFKITKINYLVYFLWYITKKQTFWWKKHADIFSHTPDIKWSSMRMLYFFLSVIRNSMHFSHPQNSWNFINYIDKHCIIKTNNYTANSFNTIGYHLERLIVDCFIVLVALRNLEEISKQLVASSNTHFCIN